MKLLSVQLARTTWLLDVAEINPRGKNIFVDLIPALTTEFDFKAFPREGDDLKEGMKLTQGTFTNSKDDTLHVALTIWNDGMVADTFSSTTDSDEFLAQVAKLLPELGYAYEPAMVRRQAHLSQIFIRCAKRLAGLTPKLQDFSKKVSEASEGGAFYDCSAIEFWPDQTQTIKRANFSFQKRAGDALDDDRYWSQAGVHTKKHLELLEELEALLS